jgi:hypothetical protein
MYFFIRIGDYPGQGECSGLSHCGCSYCHWCDIHQKQEKGINRIICGNYRRYLGPDHPYRTDNRFGEEERRPPPDARTHADIVRDSLHQKGLRRGGATAATMKDFASTSGVKFWCPFSILPLFNLVWDFLPDMMHVLKGIIHRHLFGLLKGYREPKPPKLVKANNSHPPDERRVRQAVNRRACRVWKKAKTVPIVLMCINTCLCVCRLP